jgi:hypothetical protein
MIAARLLVELGMDAQAAIDAVRRARPGAIETHEQELHVRGCRQVFDDPDAVGKSDDPIERSAAYSVSPWETPSEPRWSLLRGTSGPHSPIWSAADRSALPENEPMTRVWPSALRTACSRVVSSTNRI